MALSEKGKKLLEAFTNEDSPAYMDFNAAKKLAGYNKTIPNRDILQGALLDEVKKAYDEYLIVESGKALKALANVRDNPAQLGAANKIKAGDSILDRGGVVKKSQVEVKQDTPTAIIVIPAKSLII